MTAELTSEQQRTTARLVIRRAVEEWVNAHYVRDLQHLEPVANEADYAAITELITDPGTWVGFAEEDDGDRCDWNCPHEPTGTLGWPERIEASQAHCSMYVCDAPACRAHSNARVLEVTSHEGIFRPFATTTRNQP